MDTMGMGNAITVAEKIGGILLFDGKVATSPAGRKTAAVSGSLKNHNDTSFCGKTFSCAIKIIPTCAAWHARCFLREQFQSQSDRAAYRFHRTAS